MCNSLSESVCLLGNSNFSSFLDFCKLGMRLKYFAAYFQELIY